MIKLNRIFAASIRASKPYSSIGMGHTLLKTNYFWFSEQKKDQEDGKKSEETSLSDIW